MTKEFLNEVFEYRDGMLYWKTTPARRIISGSRAGGLRSDGYWRIILFRKEYVEHRLIWFMHNGITIENIDHKDGIKLNNKIENLRTATVSQNSCNLRTTGKNSSGFKGVSYNKEKNKWLAQIKANKQYYFLGYHNLPEAAYEAYKIAANKYHGEFANFNP